MATSIEPHNQDQDQDRQQDRPKDQVGAQDGASGQGGSNRTLLVSFLVVAVVLIVLIWIVLGEEYAIPLILLGVICAVATGGFFLISSRNRDPSASEEGGLAAGDSRDEGGVSGQGADPSQPLGDTAEAHDEINPHDFPLYNPGRRTAQRLAGGGGGTTRGMDSGGAAGRGGREEGDSGMVGDDESQGAQLTEKT